MAKQMRRMNRLSSAEAKAIVMDLLACAVETQKADEMIEGFRIKMQRLYGREPTEGELGLFRKEFAQAINGLVKRGKKARPEVEKKGIG